MFDYTTENVLNDLSRVSVALPATDKAVPTGGTGLKIKNLNTFIVSHMSPVWKASAVAAAKEVVQITLPTITAGLYRLQLGITLSGSADADYSRFAIDYGKPVHVEFNLTGTDTATTIAAKLTKYFHSGTAPAAYRGLTVTATGANLSITAGTEYQRFTTKLAGSTSPVITVFQKFNETTQIFENVSTATTITTPGNQGFGTAWDLLKNLRIPTQEATYFTAENLDERPIAGTLYNQYTFRYEYNRNIHGTGVVGELARSVTTHVLYVLSTLSTTFEGLLATAGATLVVAGPADAATPVDDEQGSDVVTP